ncbi:Ig-like domain-containing protein, partial [Pedobacter sp. CFBP9032]|nr:Ig-like domain-containing protein [Pedobacter sp. CFBP9032]
MKLAYLFLLVFGMQTGFAQAQTNVALGKTVTSSGNFDAVNFPISNLTDGNFNTIAHTSNANSPTNAEWLMIDLGSDVFINRVNIGDRPGSNRVRRFMIVTFPSIVGAQNPSLLPAQGGAVNPQNYLDGANASLYNRLIYTQADQVFASDPFGKGTDAVPGPAGTRLAPAFPGNTATAGGQLSLNIGTHKARYVLLITLQDDYLDPTELQVFEAPTPFVRAFVNGSFEQGPTVTTRNEFIREDKVPGWSATEAVGMSSSNNTSVPTDGSFLEIWRSGFNNVVAKQGNYFAELNAFTNGMLEQPPLCVLNGETFTWSFAHRGRGGVDVMALRINDIDVARFSDNNAQAGTHSAAILTPGTTTLTAQNTDANGWTQYTGTWRNTTGSIQKVSYGYRAVSASGSTTSVSNGNFIDNVSLASLSSFVSFSSATATGPETTPTANLPRLLISGTTTAATTVQLIVGGTATRGSDYTTPTATSGNITVNIPAGTYDGTAATGINLAPYIRVSTDLVSPEPDETITLALTNPSAGLAIGELSSCTDGTSNSTYTITDSCIPATVTGPASGCVGGSTLQLTGSGTPATNNPWVSSNPSVATVDNNGLVTPVSAGNTTITYTNNTGCTATIAITINPQPTITGTTNACIGATSQLTGSATAATNNPWVSSNTAIATVSNTGLVTGVAAGTSNITYTNSNGCSQQVTFTVNELPTITGTSSVCVAGTTQLTGSATAATNNPWVSSNTAIATVDNTGLVTGVAAGTSTITYTNSNGCIKQLTVTVNALPTITGTTSVCVAATTQLTGSGTAATTDPWVSSAPAIATVNNTGLVTGVAPGTAVITYTNNNGCTRQVTVTVNAIPTITGTTAVCIGSTSQLSGSPTAATNNPWVSSNTAVATINNTGLVNSVAVGTTTITYTNSNGCSEQVTFTVNALPTITGTSTVCVGSTTQLTGSATAATNNPWVSSNTAVATVDNNGLVTGVAAGSAIITYTNSNGCTRQVTVTVNALPTITGATQACVGKTTQLTGSATAAANNPWVSSNTAVATVSNTGLVTGIAAGTATITYTNSNGCSSTTGVTINTIPDAPTATAVQPTCTTATGSISVTTPSGSQYTYSIDGTNYQASKDFTNVSPGTYSVTARNSDGCTSDATNVTINAQPTTPAAPTTSVVQPTCTTATGSITVTAPTGSQYTYSIDGTNYQASTAFNNLASGTYSVTTRNNEGCTSAATSVTINPQPATPAAPTTSVVQPTCTTATGSITVTTPTGSQYTYSIDGTNYQASTVFNNLASGTYSVTTRNNDGCTSAATNATINAQPATPAAPTTSVVQPTCTTATGSISVTTPSGSQYTYSIDGTNYQVSKDFTNVSPGTYSVTARNSDGCTSDGTSVTINAQPATPAAPTTSVVQPTCTAATGGITVTTPTGSQYTYSIDGTNYQASTVFNNLASGTYSVTTRNNDGCTSAATNATINAQPATPAAPTTSVVQPTCTTATGSISVTTPSGSQYTYSIDGTNYQASKDFTNVSPGTYSVTARNNDGCTSDATSVTIDPQPATPATPTLGAVVQPTSCTPTGSFTITNYNAAYTYTVSPSAGVTIAGDRVTAPAGTYTVSATLGSCTSGASASVTLTRPATLTAVISSSTNVKCFGESTGSATVSVTGGTSPYTYSWNSNPVQTSATANNLAAGTYTVTVTDASGCSTTQDVTITQPAAGLSITGTVINSTCGATNNGSIDITLSGGTTPYTYQWNSGETTQDISNKAAGTYTVTVTDAKSCATSSSFTVTAGNCQPTAVNDFGNTTPGVPVSGNAATNDTPSGDGGNVWSLIGTDGGATLGSVTMNTDGSFTYTPKPNTSGTDTFTYHVCDVDGDCSTAIVTITIDASTLNISTTSTNVKCYGNSDGSATVTATGGTSPYTYSWNTSPVQVTATASNLAAGSYTVTVTDNVGTIRTETITITQPSSALVANVDIPPLDVKCFGENTGSATASATGGTGPYTYSWNTSPVQNTATASNLSAGNYTVTVTDANGCTDSKSVAIAQPAAALSINITSQNVICYGANTGSATASASGGTSPYNYSWNTNPVQASATANNLTAGTYTVTVTDANGCSTTQDVTITEPAGPVPAPTVTNVQPTCTTATGSIFVTTPTGSQYTYSIDGTNYQASTDFTNVSPGTYSVTARNSDGCTSAATSVTINAQPATPAAPTANVVQPTCTTATGSISVATPRGSQYTYSIDGTNYQASTEFNNLASGTYSVTARNSDGCTSAATTIIIDQANCPAIRLTKTGTFADANNNGKAEVGETITYTFKVENTGNVTVSDIKITDPKVTVTGGPVTLAPGAVDATSFTAAYTVTQADVDAGRVDNLATATGTDPKGNPVTDDSENGNPTDPNNPATPTCPTCTITPLPASPAIRLTKTGTFADANNNGKAEVGETITYTFKVENTGNVTVSDIKITDPKVTVTGGPVTLAPGAVDNNTFTANYTITQADVDAGRVDNLATAKGTDPKGNPVTDDSENGNPTDPNNPATPTCPTCTITPLPASPAIRLTKTGTFADANNNGKAEVGETITYTFKVENTGNVTVSDIKITDPKVTVTGGPVTLAPGAVDATSFTAAYTITQA